MHLRDYLKQVTKTQKDFAEMLGITQSYFWEICDDRRVPSERLSQRIEKETKGAVTSAELRRKHDKRRCPTCGHTISGR